MLLSATVKMADNRAQHQMEEEEELQTALILSLHTECEEDAEYEIALAVSLATACEEEEQRAVASNTDTTDEELEKLSLAVALSLSATSDPDLKKTESDPVFECRCCYDDSCSLDEMLMCGESCMFCRECVRRGAEVAIGEGNTVIHCFAGCGSLMGDDALQIALPHQAFDQLQQHRQMEEVEAAGFEDLERCPACNYAIIMSDTGFTVLMCGNPSCGKETCRLCKEVFIFK